MAATLAAEKKLMRRTLLLSVLLLAVLPLAARAADFDYTYAEGAYTSLSGTGNGSSPSGVTVDSSFGFDPHWHAIAGGQHVSGANAIFAGAGWNTSVAEQLDVFVEGELLSTDIVLPSTKNGWGAIGGVRFLAAPKFELDGFVSHTSVTDQTENTLGVRGLLSLDRNWWLFASYANNSDYDTFMLGVRYNF